ncbi:AraC-like DNA-binding protein [Nocardia transvalensis]|uniref:AraC-like DNA-binding protein n=1 Tax=Nocardia transvalensis TaxID=37333 RepID=A0A7W9UGU9_9NOCA|nr:AraC family transcriptional regulator [Nocardia transvalensis]MBB5912679.1 AraC-like DNA-binding protein [Nocardia transvalensis]
MPLVLDTETVDATDRAELTAAALEMNSAPMHLKLAGPGTRVSARLENWELGATNFSRLRVTGFATVRSPKLIRVSPSPKLLLIYLRQTAIHWAQGEVRQAVAPNQLFIVDLNTPYEAEWSGGKMTGLEVPLDQLALPADTIQLAMPQLQASPVYQLFVRQLAYMDEDADALYADPAASFLGDACVEIVRAMLGSAAGSGTADGTALPADILFTQIRHYIRRHLDDPNLDATRIARAHHVSVRYLYKLCARAGLRLEQWIISQRLHRARADLARPELRHHTIAVIAYRHGFRDATHFTRRFRAAYGMTPVHWRRIALDGKP